jgi:hypothetical protein
MGTQSRVCQVRCQFLCLPVNQLTILTVASFFECSPTATSLRLLTSKYEVQMKSWQQRCVFPPKLGITTSHAGGVKDY